MSALTTDLPPLADPYPLTPAQIAEFQANGHILLRGVCQPDELAPYRSAIVEAVAELGRTRPDLASRDTYGKAFLQLGNLWQRDETVKRFVFGERFARIAAELLGVAGVRLYHDQALFKEPHGGHTPWHQDEHYWPLATDQTITMWMPTVDLSADMGTMTFASGSHCLGYLGDMPISDRSEERIGELVRERGYTLAATGDMAAGDATFHTGWTLHCAPGNATERMREAMTIIWFEDGARVAEPQNANQENDLRTWLPGCRPGALAASPLNPRLYPPAT